LTDASEATLNIINATIPARSAFYVDRNGVFVWGGVVWFRHYNSEAQRLSFAAREFESYFERRLITATQAFAGVDQFTIAQTLLGQAQAATNGSIGVVVPNKE